MAHAAGKFWRHFFSPKMCFVAPTLDVHQLECSLMSVANRTFVLAMNEFINLSLEVGLLGLTEEESQLQHSLCNKVHFMKSSNHVRQISWRLPPHHLHALRVMLHRRKDIAVLVLRRAFCGRCACLKCCCYQAYPTRSPRQLERVHLLGHFFNG